MIIDAVCVTSTYKKRQKIKCSGGIIEEVGDLSLKADYTFSDDCLLFSGMGDIHIHAREDVSGKNCYKEDFTTALAAMHQGGVIHAGDMPNNPIPPINAESFEAKKKLADEKTCGAIWLYAGIGPETSPLPYPVPYKAYMGPSIGELYFKDLQSLDKAIARYAGQSVSFHCEDPQILEDSKTHKNHNLRRPVEAEVVATKDALMLIEKYKLKGKLCHYSSGHGLELIRQARSRGVSVELEVTPQHLYFDLEHIPENELGLFQMNPPIRHEADRKALFEALKNGEIQYLATDHAPHTMEEKKSGTSGLTGLDTYGAFVTWLIDQGIDPKLIATVASENPGAFQGRFYSYLRGKLEVGYEASFTVLNLNKPIKITNERLKTKVGHGPFNGVTFPGQLEALFVAGKKL